MNINWGFLGAGYVATRAMAPAVHKANGARLYAVASRDTHRSEALEPQKIHSSYDALLADDSVDAVYIGLANHQHLEWVIRSLRAGKHVLCEKPLGITSSDVSEMYDIASECNRSIVEATWVRWHPRFQRLVSLSASGEIGDVQDIQSAFTFMSDMKDNYRLQPHMGGGAHLDVGCYQVHTWVAIFGDVLDVSVQDAEQHIGSTGVDLTTRAQVNINGYTTATSVSSFAMTPVQSLSVQGSSASIHMMQGEAFTSWRETSSLQIGDTEESFPAVDAFEEMITNVSRYLSDGSGWIFPKEHTVRVAQIMDDISSTARKVDVR